MIVRPWRRMMKRWIALGFAAFVLPAASDLAAPESGVLVGTVVDEKTRENLPCRVYLVGSDGKFYFPETRPDRDVVIYDKQRGESVERHATIGPQPFRARLPVGKARVTIERGKEYVPLSQEVEITAGREARRTFVLRRWINMAERGWYSGDTHVHRSPEELPNIMPAEDLNVAFPLEQWVTRAYTPPDFKTDPAVMQRAKNGLSQIDPTHVFHLLNCEYEIFSVGKKRWTLGAIMILDAARPFEAGTPPIGPIAADAHRQGALLDLDKHNWPWSLMLVPVAKVDLYELSNNHLWRAKFHFRQFGEPAPDYLKITPDARGWALYGFEVYYTLLNCGFRLAPSAGTASGVHPVPLGWSRVYAKVDGPFTYEKWVGALRAGRSFVTVGPMLFLTVKGREPGATIRLPTTNRPRLVQVRIDVDYVRPVETVEVIVNGEVAKTFALDTNLPSDRGHHQRLECSIALDRTSWIAARCFEKPIPDNFHFAHTGPVYVSFGDEPIRPRKREVDYLIGRMEEELERNRGTLRPEGLREYEQALRAYREIAKRAIQPTGAKTTASADAVTPMDECTRLFAKARKAYAAVDNYTATLVKQERVDGKLLPRETGLFKFRKPFAVYIKWHEGPNRGTQALYVRGQNNGRLLARKGGLLGLKTFRLDPNGRLAMSDSRHPITEAGIGNTLNLLETNRKRAVAQGCARVRRLPDDPRAKPPGVRFELIVDADEKAGYYCRRAIITFDRKTGLISAVQVFDWKNQLIEDYRYFDLKINPGLTNRDFDPNNPEYNF